MNPPGARAIRPQVSSARLVQSKSFTMESFMPTFAHALMVPFIKSLVIVVTNPVPAPIGIGSMIILQVNRMGLIPSIPFRRIPVSRPDNINRSISVIWGPAIFRAEKVVQDPIREPIAVVKNPRGIRPNPRCRGRTRGWRCIDLCLGKCRHCADRPSSQQNCQRQNYTELFHLDLPYMFIRDDGAVYG